MRLTLRPYQIEAHEAVSAAWDDSEPAMLVMATGTGKTITGLNIAHEEIISAGGRVAWLAHREELLLQPLAALRNLWPGVSGGIVQAGRDDNHAQVVFASVDTLRNDNRIQGMLEHGDFALVVVDEAHHSTTPTHQKAINGLVAKGTRLLGLTATPDREDGADLGEHWSIVYSYDMISAVRDGYLVPPFAAVAPVPDIDLSRVGSFGGDYNAGELGSELIRQGIVDHTVDQIRRTHLARSLPDRDEIRYLDASARSALVFTATVEQARLTAEALSEAGIVARYLHGGTPKADRRAIIAAFAAGKIQVICNPAVLTEGTDIPRASMVVLARPTRSWSLYVQMAGRALRLYEGKAEGFVLDLAGASDVHSLVAAPVLIGGSKCKKSDNGEHEFRLEGDGPKGKCVHCKATIACMAAGGAHKWHDGEDGKRSCSACGSPQCPESVDGRHHWMPMEDGKRICIDCGAEANDPHAGMLKRRAPEDLGSAEWLRIPDVVPESWAVDAGDHGTLLVVGDRREALWDAYWVKKGGRKARRLSSARIPKDLVRTYADDIVRRARKYDGWRPVTDKQRAYAERVGADLSRVSRTGDANREISRAKARKRLLALGLARESQ